MDNPQDSIKTMVVKARQEQILKAAAKVFARLGFHQATNKDIADEAGVSAGTIYNYFESKNDLLIQILNKFDEIDERTDLFADVMELDFKSAFSVFMKRHLARYLPNLNIFKAILPEVIIHTGLRKQYYEKNIKPTRKLLEEHIQARIDRGEFHKVEASTAARMLVSLLLGSMLLIILEEEQPPTAFETQSETIGDILTNGLRTRTDDD